MKNLKPIFWIFICVLVPLLTACPGDDPKVKSKTEMITKNWRVRQVRIANQVVYANPAGTTPNTQDFGAYGLHFTSATAFVRTEQNGNSTTRTWQFDDNENPTKITFSTGIPSEVKIEPPITDESLVIFYTTESSKTGPSSYRIELIPAQ